MSDYRVNLDIFAGPMDLLLYLVRKEEVDIYDIHITKITNQYLQYIEILKKLDIDLAGGFLVMAATLMQLKSAMLLPKADAEDISDQDTADPRSELIRQLLEYKKFKDAANMLSDAADEAKDRFSRPDTVIQESRSQAEPDIDLDQVSVWDLLEAFDSIMAATGSYTDISHISDDTPIDLYQIEILHRLQSEGAMSFEKIFEPRPTRTVMIGLFLALLELIREKLVWVEQPKNAKTLLLKSLTDEPAEQAVQSAIINLQAEAETIEDQRSALQQTPQIPIVEIGQKSHTAVSTDITQTRQPSVPIAELPPKENATVSTDEFEKIDPTPNDKSG